MKNISICLLILVILALSFQVLSEKKNFPVKYNICMADYSDCSTVAKFDDRESCETTSQKWGWYCDENDKSNIICQEKASSVATGYCD